MRLRPLYLRLLSLRGLAMLLIMVGTSLPLDAFRARSEGESINLEILQRRNELAPLMSTAQQLRLARIEKAIAKANSDIRSGEFMAEVTYSIVRPERDLNAIRAEGRDLIAKAQAELEENQKALVKLLEKVTAAQAAANTRREALFDVELPSGTFAETLPRAVLDVYRSTILEDYQNLFFDQAFLRGAERVVPTDDNLRDRIREELQEIDSSSVLQIPSGFQINPRTRGDTKIDTFQFDRSENFKDARNALIWVEIVVPRNSRSGLLSVQSIDMESHRILAHQLYKIEDAAEVAGLPESEELGDRGLRRIQLRDSVEIFQRFAALPEPYIFELQIVSTDVQVRTLLGYSLLKNSNLLLSGSDFIRSAYGQRLDRPENWIGQKTARILVAESSNEDYLYQIGLQARDSERTLPGGSVKAFTAPSPSAD